MNFLQSIINIFMYMISIILKFDFLVYFFMGFLVFIFVAKIFRKFTHTH